MLQLYEPGLDKAILLVGFRLLDDMVDCEGQSISYLEHIKAAFQAEVRYWWP